MYLLDNHKNNLEMAILKKISSVQNLKELNSLSISSFDGIESFFNKVSRYGGPFLSDTTQTKKNILNLFLLPPINLTKDSKEFSKIKDNYQVGKFQNYLEYYKKILLSKIDKTESSSYDIVGEMTSSISKLFYGNKIINKSDMDVLLFSVSKLNKSELSKEENSINENSILSEILILSKELYNDDIPKDIQNKLEIGDVPGLLNTLSLKITNINDNLFENKNFEEIKDIKFRIFFNMKNEIINLAAHLGIKEDDTLNFQSSTKDIVLEAKDVLDEARSVLNMLEETLIKSDKDSNKYIESKIKEVKENSESISFFISKSNKIIEEADNELSKKLSHIVKDSSFSLFENKISDLSFVSLSKEDYLKKLNKFQKINKKYLEGDSLSQSIDSISKTASFFEEKDSNTVFINVMKEVLSFPNLKDYNIEDIKDFLIISLSNNKTIYDLLNNDTVLNKNSIKSNKFLKDFTLSKNNFKGVDKDRIKYIFNIIVNSENLESLFKTDFNMNIKNLFFSKLNLSVDSKNANSKLKEVFNVLKDFNQRFNIKNQNILIGIILESYENKDSKLSFNEARALSLINILRTPINRLNGAQKETLNTLTDSWIKWSITYNRELKNNNLLMSSINPIKFEFGKMQSIIKEINNAVSQEVVFTRHHYSMYQHFLENVDTFKNEDILKIFELDYLKNNENPKMIYLYYRSLENIYESNLNFIDKKTKDITLDFMEVLKKSDSGKESEKGFDKYINEVVSLSKLKNFLNDDRIDISKINMKGLFNVIKTNGDISEAMKNLPSEVYYEVLESIDSIPKISGNKLSGYIDYFAEMSKTEIFKNFNKEDSKITLLDGNLGNGYTYKVKTIKDFDILLTGEKTDNCMSYEEVGWKILGYMHENPKNNVIFEVYKNGKAIANSWTWLDEENKQLTFDNIEVLGDELRDNVMHCYRKASIQFLNSMNINMVNFGVGYTDIDIDRLGGSVPKSNYNKLKSNVYSDAENQKIIISNDKVSGIDFSEMERKLRESKNFLSKEEIGFLDNISTYTSSFIEEEKVFEAISFEDIDYDEIPF